MIAEQDGGVDIGAWLKRNNLYERHFPHVLNNWGRWEPIPDYNPAQHGTNPERYVVTKAEFEAIRAEFLERGLID